MVTTTTITTTVASSAAPAPAPSSASGVPSGVPVVGVTGGGGSIGGGGGGVSVVTVDIEGGVTKVVTTISVTSFTTVTAPGEEGTSILVVEGSFSGTVVISISVTKFSMGSSKAKRGAKSRSSKIIFSANRPAVKAILISITINTGRRRQSVGDGNALFQHWLNKYTNEWIVICSDSNYDTNTGALQTVTPAVVFNDPAFNPTSGCAPDYDGACDGSGGEFTVFELPADSCVPYTGDSSGDLSDGEIAGIVIGSVVGFGIVAYLAFALCLVRFQRFFTSHHRNDDRAPGLVRSSIVVSALGLPHQDDANNGLMLNSPAHLEKGSFTGPLRPGGGSSIMSIAAPATISLGHPPAFDGPCMSTQIHVVPFQDRSDPIGFQLQESVMYGVYQPVSDSQTLSSPIQSFQTNIQPTSLYPAVQQQHWQ